MEEDKKLKTQPVDSLESKAKTKKANPVHNHSTSSLDLSDFDFINSKMKTGLGQRNPEKVVAKVDDEIDLDPIEFSFLDGEECPSNVVKDKIKQESQEFDDLLEDIKNNKIPSRPLSFKTFEVKKSKDKLKTPHKFETIIEDVEHSQIIEKPVELKENSSSMTIEIDDGTQVQTISLRQSRKGEVSRTQERRLKLKMQNWVKEISIDQIDKMMKIFIETNLD